MTQRILTDRGNTAVRRKTQAKKTQKKSKPLGEGYGRLVLATQPSLQELTDRVPTLAEIGDEKIDFPKLLVWLHHWFVAIWIVSACYALAWIARRPERTLALLVFLGYLATSARWPS